MTEYIFIIRIKSIDEEHGMFCSNVPIRTRVVVKADTIYDALAEAARRGAEQLGQLYSPVSDQLIITQESTWYA